MNGDGVVVKVNHDDRHCHRKETKHRYEHEVHACKKSSPHTVKLFKSNQVSKYIEKYIFVETAKSMNEINEYFRTYKTKTHNSKVF